jgi:hypothetical protein
VKILFASDPMRARQVDPAHVAEAAAAVQSGFAFSSIDLEALVDRSDAQRAVRSVDRSASGNEIGIYRGWMMTPEKYALLYDALAAKGILLINTPAAYRHCHHLPESYALIAGRTPQSVWLHGGPDFDIEAVMNALRSFGDRPLVLKDFVKSRKHEWAEACFIPRASDRAAVERVVRRFVELQGEALAGGLVFREFVELEPIGVHPQSGMPLTREHRIFWLDTKPLLSFAYWSDVGQVDEGPPLAQFRDVAEKIQSRFFTMDVAKLAGGDWVIVELGDAQVAGLPEDEWAVPLYRQLKERGELGPGAAAS